MTKWKKIPDGGWLQGAPAYTAPAKDGNTWHVARDYDDPEAPNKKMMWFLHLEYGNGDNDFIQAFDTLKEAKEFVFLG